MLPGRDGLALVLGGGGAKGSYQIGVIEALSRLNLAAEQVWGVSVGALNAAMYAQGALVEADRLWREIRLSDLVSEETLALADAAENAMNHPEKVMDFLARYSKQKGADIAPFESLLRRTVDEEAIRQSAVRYGLVTTRVNGMALVARQISDIAPGMLADWMIASAACFPIFPMKAIGDERYIDGGFCDNTPVAAALRAGARHVIAVDIGRHRAHTRYDRRPNVTYIRASRPLGGMMAFDPARAAFNRQLGVNDTLRAFGLLRGFSYAFDSGAFERERPRAEDFLSRLSQIESAQLSTHAISLPARERAPFFSLLEEGTHGELSALDYWLRACELLMDIAALDPLPIYTPSSLASALAAALPLERAQSLSASLAGGHIGALFAPPHPDKKLAVACLMLLLRERGMDFPLAGHAAASFPREFVSALALGFLL